ncbi:MAG: hypothetical protein HC894_31175 [Microcoleus sp. SM1_3_4]|nr:hypothetical protein [Microcoleus sp. SM1_3_4]
MLDRIDQQLTQWQQHLDLVSQNLLDLYDLSTYQRLVGNAGFPKTPLNGTTQQQVLPALAALTDVFRDFDLLRQTIEQALDLRQQLPRWLGNDDRLQEIDRLLNTSSILLPSVNVPLAQRNLLSAAQTCDRRTPSQLLAAMVQAFDRARDVVLAVDAAWCQWEPNLLQWGAQLRSIQQQAIAMEISVPELPRLEAELQQMQQQIESDPLGVSAIGEKWLQAIANVKTRLEQAVAATKQLRDRLQHAIELLADLKQLQTQATDTVAEFHAKILEPTAVLPALSEETIAVLAQWLERLQTKAADSRSNASTLNAVATGLGNWEKQAESAIATVERAIDTSQYHLQLRQELRGRLDALTAKALAKGKAEDRELSELAIRAKQLLYSRPTPMDRSIDLVTAYERRLNDFRF